MSVDPVATQLAEGTRIGPYSVTRLIGAGGMGQVYRAHDDRLQRDVAVKLMTGDASGDATDTRRMLREARAASQLNHPNIVAVFDVGTHEGRVYVVTELLDGESLRDVVRRGRTPWRAALRLAEQVAEGLGAAHARAIVHRDIKPDNVFLTRDGRIKILDFGVATWRPEGGPAASAATVSQDGLLVGTLGYMSPEQARGETVDARTDIFAFGCLLYELLAGKQAFEGVNMMKILVAIQRDPPPALHDIVEGLPEDLVRIIDRCLEKDAARRFQSAADLLFALSLVQTAAASVGRLAAVPAAAPVSSRSVADAPMPLATPSGVQPTPPGSAPRARWIVAALLVGALGATIASRVLTHEPEPVGFRQVTFGHGNLYTARFTPDGSTIVYSAAWDGKPRELFATLPASRDVRSLGQLETDVTGFLSSGEMTIIRRPAGGYTLGVFARMSVAGGLSKDLLEAVYTADSIPSSASPAVVRHKNGRAVLEMPPGHALADAPAIRSVRISPDATHVAFLEYADPDDEAGRVIVVDTNGARVLESDLWRSIEGLAWRSDGEVWFTASKAGRSLWMYATDLRGKTRLVCRVPGRLTLHDVAADGRALAERNSYRASLLVGTVKPSESSPKTAETAVPAREQDASWQDFSQLGQLSADGTRILFSEIGDGAGESTTAYLGPVSGGAPLRLGTGVALALAPDGRRALLRVDEPLGTRNNPATGRGPHLEVVPVGAGAAQKLAPGPLVAIAWAAFLPDGARIVMRGAQASGHERLYVQDLAGGEPRAISRDGTSAGGDAVSPDGAFVAGVDGDIPKLFPIDGGEPIDLPEIGARAPLGWTSDGGTLFTLAGRLPMHIERYDRATHAITPWHTLAPADPAGIIYLDRVHLARDGEVYAYESYRLLSDLYVIDNLR